MRYIALEEAFSIPGLDDRQPSPWLGLPLSQRHLADWARKLPDFTEYRMPEVDAAGIDVQVLSLTVPGLQGHYLDEPRYDEVWAALEELSVPLYLHPGAPPPTGGRYSTGAPSYTAPPGAGPRRSAGTRCASSTAACSTVTPGPR
jgi:predicted TIM-barrel fold metal-dependent hydrolase